jgi:hypothetical protein
MKYRTVGLATNVLTAMGHARYTDSCIKYTTLVERLG